MKFLNIKVGDTILVKAETRSELGISQKTKTFFFKKEVKKVTPAQFCTRVMKYKKKDGRAVGRDGCAYKEGEIITRIAGEDIVAQDQTQEYEDFTEALSTLWKIVKEAEEISAICKTELSPEQLKGFLKQLRYIKSKL